MLSPRRAAIAALVAEGCSNKDIAHRLDMSVETVKAHMKYLVLHFGATNRTQIAVKVLATHCDELRAEIARLRAAGDAMAGVCRKYAAAVDALEYAHSEGFEWPADPFGEAAEAFADPTTVTEYVAWHQATSAHQKEAGE